MNKISGHEVTIAIGTALPKLDWVVEGVLNFIHFHPWNVGQLGLCILYSSL